LYNKELGKKSGKDWRNGLNELQVYRKRPSRLASFERKSVMLDARGGRKSAATGLSQ